MRWYHHDYNTQFTFLIIFVSLFLLLGLDVTFFKRYSIVFVGNASPENDC